MTRGQEGGREEERSHKPSAFPRKKQWLTGPGGTAMRRNRNYDHNHPSDCREGVAIARERKQDTRYQTH